MSKSIPAPQELRKELGSAVDVLCDLVYCAVERSGDRMDWCIANGDDSGFESEVGALELFVEYLRFWVLDDAMDDDCYRERVEGLLSDLEDFQGYLDGVKGGGEVAGE